MAKIVFDCDDTIAKIIKQEDSYTQVPDYDLMQVLRWFINNGDEVYVWSAGGIEYAETWTRKLGIHDQVKIIPKVELGAMHPHMDIAFDDSETGLAKVNIRVKRELGMGPKRT
jgi:peroxiredoxin